VSHWQQIRALARARHAEVFARTNGDPSASALIAATADLTGIPFLPVAAGDALLDGGEAQLDAEAGVIWYSNGVDPLLIPFYQAHEYAHHWLDHGPVVCDTDDLDGEASEEPVPLGVQRVEGYGPQERREREANVFAREFLLPAPALREWFPGEGLDASAIARRTQLPEGLVLHQLARALLTPDFDETHEGEADTHFGEDAEHEPDLDPSQRAAALVECGPLLVEAGPGTGKTRTLVARIAALLERDVEPSSILALTFSNKAAEEMRLRVALAAPEAAPSIWMGTFHAFGLELLRKYGERIGLPPDPHVLDPVAAFLLLERELPALGLVHYQNLYEPTTYLRDILAAISRAKDELCSPDDYAALARRMRTDAVTPDEIGAAERALEVARVYAFYQDRLAQEGWVDFGDLISRAVELLRSHHDVREAVRRAFPQVLVDEYQDVNRASGLLLREIAGDGTGLWVVGDVRQAIYRFRGAAPSNMRRFAEDFPGAQRVTLSRNYRSRPAIVDVFAELAPQMRATAGDAFEPWDVHRADGDGQVLMEIAEDGVAEVRGLAREIERHRAAGIAYREQAILCRSHTVLARIADGLERAGVPVLYLGDLFERPEIRDLLALVQLACEPDGRSLIRVARFAEYGIPLADVQALWEAAAQQAVPFPRALDLAEALETLSPAGKTGLALLRQHLDGLCYEGNPWSLLARYLFERGRYVHRLLQDDSIASRQRRIAIHQLLQFAHGWGRDAENGGLAAKRDFLRYIRQLEIYGEEKQLRQAPEWAAGLDAVRLLTIHASKGLEFDAVYLPALGGRYFPASRQANHCPPPVGMIADDEDGHDEEEECLLFVAASRACDVLCFSRARRYETQTSNPSRLLGSIAARLPRRPDGEVTWPAPPAGEPLVDAAPLPHIVEGKAPVFDVEALDVYLTCPEKYYDEFVLGLGGHREDAAYAQFHRCVYGVLRFLAESREQGRTVAAAEALARLAALWANGGPVGHPYEVLYREQAEAMVVRAVAWGAGRAIVASPTWEVSLPHGRVRVTPDQVEVADAETGRKPIVRRLRTGRPSASEQEKDVYALYLQAARDAHPDAEVETLYVAADEAVPLGMTEKKLQNRLDRYDAAIVGILQGKFDPKPNDRECPRCPHYFICSANDDH
jgi:DNA helicase II / ATP-dependent DNA helicase PcrA